MADKSKNKNVFQKIAQVYKEVRQELRKSTWPSKEKLKNTSAVVLAVIAFFAVLLSFISLGGRWVLDKINFYDEVEPTATVSTEVTAVTEAVTIEETAAETEAVSETEAASETEVAETAETAAESEG
ncbi:MAG: preprotein translocase subunit SecE [Clostridiales bacterium]|nr:preprotein translocase subunit SecE [Clostridiales bacterium]